MCLPSSPTRRGIIQLASRRAGKLTDYLFDHLFEGEEVGIRGPLGNGVPVERLEGSNLMLVAGGLGMVARRGVRHWEVWPLRRRLHLHLFARAGLFVLGRDEPPRADLHVGGAQWEIPSRKSEFSG